MAGRTAFLVPMTVGMTSPSLYRLTGKDRAILMLSCVDCDGRVDWYRRWRRIGALLQVLTLITEAYAVIVLFTTVFPIWMAVIGAASVFVIEVRGENRIRNGLRRRAASVEQREETP